MALTLSTAVAAVLSVVISVSAQAQTSASLRPVDLRVEARTEPVGIDVVVPRLSWQLTAEARAQRQRAYRILVASERVALDDDHADVWDSGKVESDRTFGIEYGGPPLAAHTLWFWKVMVWDGDDRPSAWSAPASWSTGVLDPAEWGAAAWIGYDRYRGESKAEIVLGEARWIAPGDTEPRDAPAGRWLFACRRELPKDAAIAAAELIVLADDRASCVVNGSTVFADRVGWRDPTPHDVTGLLRGGVNDLRVQVENGSRGPTGLVVDLRIRMANGETVHWVTDGGWVAGEPYAGWHEGALREDGMTPVRVLGAHGIKPWGATRNPQLDLPPVPHLRTVFTVDAPVRRAMLYGTALGNVDFHLNGERVSDERFTPGWTDYRIRVPYRAWDVTDRIQDGENVLGALLADGWFAGYIGWGRVRDHYGRNPRLRALLRLELADGSVRTVASDAAWHAAIGPTREADFLMGERYDAREALDGWDTHRYDADGWDAVDVGAELAPTIAWHPGPPVGLVREFRPIAITEVTPGTFVFDLGQNFAGVVRLTVRGERGREIRLRFAERLNPDGTVYTTNLRGARATDTYVCRGDGEEVWTPRFTFHGFQYVEVTGLAEPPTEATITGIALSSLTRRAGSFSCSDPTLDQLWRNVLWTQRANFIDVPTDCPQRDERLGWTGDAQVYVRTATLNADVQAFFTKWLQDLADAQRDDGQFPMVAPLVVAGDDGGPAWADAGTIVPWAMWEVYGDRRLLARQYPTMVRFVEFCERRSIDDVLPPAEFHCFGDWLSIDAPTPKALIYTAYYAHSVDLTRRAAEVLGERDAAERFAALHARIRDAFVRTFFDGDGRVTGDTQCGYVLALAYDLLGGELRERAAEHLIENIEARGNHLSTGFIGTKDLMLVLSDIGRSDVAWRLLMNDSFPSWRFSIRHGATSIWERWDGWTPEKGFQDPGMNSFAHYSFGAVYQWIVENVGGIRMADVAYGKVRIEPRPGGGLTCAATNYLSVRGLIVTSWQLEDERFTLDVEIPPNVDATVTVPTTDSASVRVDGVRPADAGLKVLAETPQSVTLAVPSGRWTFVASR